MALSPSPGIARPVAMAMSFHVVALRDTEARVLTPQSDSPGLVIEADTFEEFVALVEGLAP